jgi:hypothetical protein
VFRGGIAGERGEHGDEVSPETAQTAWTTADYALIVSLVSLCFAVAGFVWNVWSKFIYPKPKVRVHLDLKLCHLRTSHIASLREGGAIAGGFPIDEMSCPAISLGVTNFGPGTVIVDMATVRQNRWSRSYEQGHGVMMPYRAYPHDLGTDGFFSGGLPKKLDVGEDLTLYFPVLAELTDHNSVVAIGLRDTFSRLHWSQRSDMIRLRKQAAILKKLNIQS